MIRSSAGGAEGCRERSGTGSPDTIAATSVAEGRGERPLAGGHLVEEDAEGEDVAADIDGAAVELFRRHVLERADDRPLGGQRPDGLRRGVVGKDVRWLGEFRQPEVERDGKLLSQHLDVGSGTVTGEPSLIADDVSYFYLSARAQFSAANGVVVYRTDTTTGRLLLANRTGTTRTIEEGDPYYDASVSPDGKRAAVTVTTRATGMGTSGSTTSPAG